MEIAPKPENEARRLEVLQSLGLLNTPREERFDRFTRFAQRLFDVPIAYISLIDEDVQWFKSIQGVDIEQTPRDVSFCSHTILNDNIVVVSDLTEDRRFRDNPVVISPPYIRFYAGVRLLVRDELAIGTLCIMDTKVRSLSFEDREILKDLAGMIEQEFMAHSMATTDELTGLSNRRGFRAIAQHGISLCRRMDKSATLMFFDLDGFKAVNDNFGHAEGDKVLRDIGQILLREFRNSDVVARLGGDEFCVLLTGTNAEHIEKPLANLQSAIHEENMNVPYDIGYSVGTVAFDPTKHQKIDDLLMEADAAMYREKKARKLEQDTRKR
ncbi:MAG: sensor domain-containing diguanylate cyclase [Proteobacteria bacterium]|nr:sensor domain-containing diguanylate cyclase [Pseudomonadota bacterium]MDA1300108.1 sensor domain-containing diguanylate cyclase [Pseudomonadota bacterium]